MQKRLGWCIAAGIATALFCAACTQTSSKTPANPGELPGSRADSNAKPAAINATTFFAHGHLLERQGNLAKAVTQYEAAIQAQPDFVTAINRLGVTLNKLGRHPEATAQFHRAISLAPRVAYLYNNLGFSLYLQDELDSAEAALRKSLEIKPDFSRASMNLGMTLAKLGRFDEALDAFRTGAGGDEATAYYNLAVMQGETGRFTVAVRSLNRALEINPRLDAAQQYMSEIAETAAAQEAAEKLARQEQEFHRQQHSLSDAELAGLYGGAAGPGADAELIVADTGATAAEDAVETADAEPAAQPLLHDPVSPMGEDILVAHTAIEPLHTTDATAELPEELIEAGEPTAADESAFFTAHDECLDLTTELLNVMYSDGWSTIAVKGLGIVAGERVLPRAAHVAEDPRSIGLMIDSILDATIRGLLSWTEATCEIESLLGAEPQPESATAEELPPDEADLF